MPNKEDVTESLEAGKIDKDSIKVIIYVHAQKYPQHNKIELIKLNKNEINQTIDKILANHSDGQNPFYQIIAQMDNSAHVTTLDLKITMEDDGQKKISLINLDAAGVEGVITPIQSIMEERQDISIITICCPPNKREGLQKTMTDCPVFALDHAMVAQKIDLHQYIENLPAMATQKMGKIQFVDWRDMPPEIYRNVQSETQWTAYKEYQLNTYGAVDTQHDEYRLSHKKPEQEHPGNIIPMLRQTLTADAQNFMKEVQEQKFVEIFENPLYNQPSVDNSFL